MKFLSYSDRKYLLGKYLLIILFLVLMYRSETILGKEKERSRTRVVQMDNIRGLLGIRRMDRVLNARIREFCSVKAGRRKD